jgi:putative ubiquitin-RnfH superfamily antitoxin RatB of RatAB toxin-antitoxin module
MNIEVVISLGPRQVLSVQLVCEGETSAFAARALALMQLDLPEDTCPEWRVAVWGKPVDKNTLLKDGDRLEVLRPLLVDPKEARRLRFNQQGSRAAGLFAKRRQGAKAGY